MSQLQQARADRTVRFCAPLSLSLFLSVLALSSGAAVLMSDGGRAGALSSPGCLSVRRVDGTSRAEQPSRKTRDEEKQKAKALARGVALEGARSRSAKVADACVLVRMLSIIAVVSLSTAL
jgi:hypothetical protein